MFKNIIQRFIRKVLAISNPVEFYATYTNNRPPILHIGAHLGEEADFYRRLGFGEVNWVEAQPVIFQSLAKRFSPRNCLQAAVWSERVKLQINVSSNSVSTSLFKFGESTPWKELHTLAKIEVDAITLDDVVNEFESRKLLTEPFILLLDIQGAELQALASLKLIRSKIRAISCEVSVIPTYENSASRRDVYKIMLRNRFLPVTSFLDEKTGHGDQLFIRIDDLLLKPKLYAFFIFRGALLKTIRIRNILYKVNSV
jgi:FkbM family methyltransferase